MAPELPTVIVVRRGTVERVYAADSSQAVFVLDRDAEPDGASPAARGEWFPVTPLEHLEADEARLLREAGLGDSFLLPATPEPLDRLDADSLRELAAGLRTTLFAEPDAQGQLRWNPDKSWSSDELAAVGELADQFGLRPTTSPA